jgi:hypothetical protein
MAPIMRIMRGKYLNVACTVCCASWSSLSVALSARNRAVQGPSHWRPTNPARSGHLARLLFLAPDEAVIRIAPSIRHFDRYAGVQGRRVTIRLNEQRLSWLRIHWDQHVGHLGAKTGQGQAG